MTTATRPSTTTRLLIWQALTPVHSGTGQTSASVIDLPIAREVATNFPILPASSIKGVLRDGAGLRPDERKTVTDADKLYGYADKKVRRIVNGQEAEESESRESQLTFTDARLLCLPVRSYAGTFALVTCPLVLNRLRRDLEALGLPLPFEGVAAVSPNEVWLANSTVLAHEGQVLFEDLDFQAKVSAAHEVATALSSLLSLPDFSERLAVVPDDVFSYLAETATEVTAHVRLEPDTKTVAGGALWYEEALPAESLLTSFLISKDAKFTPRTLLQLGGKGSVGKGLLRVSVHG